MKKVRIFVCMFFAVSAMLSFAVRAAVAETVPVVPGSLCEVSFKARIVSGLSFETYPQLEDMMSLYVSRPQVAEDAAMPAVNWRFVDRNGKSMNRAWQGGAGFTLFYRAWREYRFGVYVPEGATAIRLSAYPNRKGNRAEISSVSVKTLPRSKVVNVNPDFSMSGIAVPGWQLVSAARLSLSEGSRPHVDLTGGSICSDPFPLVPGTRMCLIVRGSTCRDQVRCRPLKCSLRYLESYADAATISKHMKSASQLQFSNVKAEEKSLEFVVPEGVRWARIFANGGVLEKAEVREN